MAELYLGRWEWVTDAEGLSQWQPPGGDNIGAFDLRSLPQCAQAGGIPQGWGLFVYASPKVHPNLIHPLGSDLTRNLTAVEKSAIRTFFGLSPTTPVVDKLGPAIRQWLLDSDYYDATGQSRWKPLIGGLRKGVEFTLGGFGKFVRERFDSSHPCFAAKIAVFRADYLRNREIELIDPTILRKWTGATLLNLTGRLSDLDADALLPLKYRSDGYERPTTTISDNFNRANESLDAGPWVEVAQDWSLVSNRAEMGGGNRGLARHTTALSSDDHKCKVNVVALQTTPFTGQAGPVARFSTDAAPNEDAYYVQTTLTALEFFKVVDDVFTGLDTAKTITYTAPDDVEIECNDSAMKSRLNGVLQHDFTDTSLTGQLQCGLFARRTADKLDDFSAEDLVAGAITGPLIGFRHLGGQGPLIDGRLVYA